MSKVEDEQVIPAKEPESPKPSEDSPAQVNKTLLGVLVILALLVIGGAAFIFGSRQRTSPTPTPSPTATPAQEASISATTQGTGTPAPTLAPTHTPTPTPTPVSQTIVVSSDASLDGWRASNNGGNAVKQIQAGRNDTLIERGFVSFALSTIPSGVTIEKATLRLYQYSVIGSPYTVGLSMKVDHVNYSTLDNSAYSIPALSSSFGTLTENNVIEWKDLDVTDMIKDDLSNGRTRSQYRLHFAIESTGGTTTGDFASFESADNSHVDGTPGTGNTPQLVVKYH